MTGAVDYRLVFLARAHARLLLVEAGMMDLETFGGLIESVCSCWGWSLADEWERTHPPIKHRRGRHE
jgi:hypothetical protein